MSADDDVVRLGRDPDRVPVPLRDVFPWWFLGGAVAHLGLVVALAPLSPASSGAVLWGVLIGTTIRDRRAAVRRLLAAGTPTTHAAIAGPRWLDPALTGGFLAIGLGLSLLLGNLVRFDDEVRWAPGIAGGVLIAFGAAFLIAVRIRLRRRASADS